MTKKTDEQSYILGTETQELQRLGFQHEVWAREAAEAFDNLNIIPGETILDFGCGPGFCTIPLALRTGSEGKVIAIDKSETFLSHLGGTIKQLDLSQIELINCDFHDYSYPQEYYEVVWGRWVLAWARNAESLVNQLCSALKPGGRMAFQEYYDWKTFQVAPFSQSLYDIKQGILKSFARSEGEINVGKQLPGWMENNGLKVSSVRPRAKLDTANSPTWNWIKTFLEIYGPKVVQAGLLEQNALTHGLEDLQKMKDLPGSTILGPLVIEVIAVKP